MSYFSLFEWIAIGVASIGIGFLKRTFGAGIGLALTPVLTALTFSPKFALTFIAMASTLADIVLARELRREWDRQMVFRILPWMVGGVAVGSWVLSWIDDRSLRILIGSFCVLLSLQQIVREIRGREVPSVRLPVWVARFGGLLSGFASSVANTGSTVLSPFLISMGFSKMLFLGTVWALFFVVNPLKMIGYWQAGVLSREVFWAAGVGLPLLWVGLRIGAWAHNRMSPRVFHMIILMLAIAGGARLLLFS
ncbi:MAG: sulfite exporter TauE/SafE family protein [bacterium]|nr:sulfite exporter TauE/SafE family protein [bacterium]